MWKQGISEIHFDEVMCDNQLGSVSKENCCNRGSFSSTQINYLAQWTSISETLSNIERCATSLKLDCIHSHRKTFVAHRLMFEVNRHIEKVTFLFIKRVSSLKLMTLLYPIGWAGGPLLNLWESLGHWAICNKCGSRFSSRHLLECLNALDHMNSEQYRINTLIAIK